MAHIELRLPWGDSRLQSPDRITKYVEEELQKRGTDILMNDCIELIDDPKLKMRILKVKTRTVTVY